MCYLLFVTSTHGGTRGGWHDFVGAFPTEDLALMAHRPDWATHWHIVNAETLSIVISGKA